VKTVYLVRLRLFPADSKEIREVECTVFEYALLLLLAYARAGEQSSVVKKIALWTIDAAQKGLVACGKKPPQQRVVPVVSRQEAAPVVSRQEAAVSFDGSESPSSLERSLRGESRTKELQVLHVSRATHARTP
jgi:hypothetical protein